MKGLNISHTATACVERRLGTWLWCHVYDCTFDISSHWFCECEAVYVHGVRRFKLLAGWTVTIVDPVLSTQYTGLPLLSTSHQPLQRHCQQWKMTKTAHLIPAHMFYHCSYNDHYIPTQVHTVYAFSVFVTCLYIRTTN